MLKLKRNQTFKCVVIVVSLNVWDRKTSLIAVTIKK